MLIKELIEFRDELMQFSIYRRRQIIAKEDLSGEEVEDLDEIYLRIIASAGKHASLIKEITGLDTIKTSMGQENVWDWAFSSSQNTLVADALDKCVHSTGRAIGKLADDIEKGIRDSDTGDLIDIQGKAKITEIAPKAFIAHGGDSPARQKLRNFLEALGVQPIIVEEQPSEGRSIAENVDYHARRCDCAIILATKGDIDSKNKRFIPRGNVLIEIGKSQELFKNKIIYLLQAGAQMPTDVSEKVRARFSPQSMDNAFIKIANELKEFGILKAVKP